MVGKGGVCDPEWHGGIGFVSIVPRDQNPRVGGSNPSAATYDSPRQTPPKPAPRHELRQPRAEATVPESRQQPTQSAPIHLPTATASASVANADANDLTEIIAAWPTLPEPIRAGILAMIRSASGNASGHAIRVLPHF
jgi:hypothetical protein